MWENNCSVIYLKRILVNNFIGMLVSKFKYRELKDSWRWGYVLHILCDLSGFLDKIQRHLFHHLRSFWHKALHEGRYHLYKNSCCKFKSWFLTPHFTNLAILGYLIGLSEFHVLFSRELNTVTTSQGCCEEEMKWYILHST